MKNCTDCKVKQKKVINLAYIGIYIASLELLNKKFVLLNQLSTINSFNIIDLGLNVIISILAYSSVFFVAFSLRENYRQFKESMKLRGKTRCSIFNPFC